MSGHRIGTDRKETAVVAGCPNGCQGYELEVEGVDESVDTLVKAVAEATGTAQPVASRLDDFEQTN